MDLEGRLAIAAADLEVISSRLGELSNLIDTVHLGLMKENVEQQNLDCIMCILYFVKGLHGLAEQILTNLKQ